MNDYFPLQVDPVRSFVFKDSPFYIEMPYGLLENNYPEVEKDTAIPGAHLSV